LGQPLLQLAEGAVVEGLNRALGSPHHTADLGVRSSVYVLQGYQLLALRREEGDGAPDDVDAFVLDEAGLWAGDGVGDSGRSLEALDGWAPAAFAVPVEEEVVGDAHHPRLELRAASAELMQPGERVEEGPGGQLFGLGGVGGA